MDCIHANRTEIVGTVQLETQTRFPARRPPKANFSRFVTHKQSQHDFKLSLLRLQVRRDSEKIKKSTCWNFFITFLPCLEYCINLGHGRCLFLGREEAIVDMQQSTPSMAHVKLTLRAPKKYGGRVEREWKRRTYKFVILGYSEWKPEASFLLESTVCNSLSRDKTSAKRRACHFQNIRLMITSGVKLSVTGKPIHSYCAQALRGLSGLMRI